MRFLLLNTPKGTEFYELGTPSLPFGRKSPDPTEHSSRRIVDLSRYSTAP